MIINPIEILHNDREWLGVIPDYWCKTEYKVVSDSYFSISDVKNFIKQNLSGLWTIRESVESKTDSYSPVVNKGSTDKGSYRILIAFEDPNDKLMFELMGGSNDLREI